MKIAAIGLAMMFVLFCASGTNKTTSSSTENGKESRADNHPIMRNDAGPESSNENTKESRSENAEQQPPGAFPFSYFPTRPEFVTRENDPFLVMVLVDCASGSPNDAKIELLEPTSSFVQLSPICFREGSATALVAVTPREGDAGKHFVKIRAIPCRGPGGIINFTVKVKKAR